MDDNKDNLKRRINRRTTSAQFEKLVDHLEASPHLASGFPSAQAAHVKAKSDAEWNNITQSLNAIGPPERTAAEWKKTWSDLRSRTRLNIAEINKCDLYLTEGRSKPLNALEFRVAKLCNLVTNLTPLNNNVPKSRPIKQVAVVTPNLSSTLPAIIKSAAPGSTTTPQLVSSPKKVQNTIKKKISKQKRQVYVKELELLRKQVTAQEAIAGAIASQANSAEEHNKSLDEIAQACKIIASSMSDFIKHLK